MASGLSLPLAGILSGQALVALPLVLPFPAIRSPSILLCSTLSTGAGGYVGATLLGTVFVLLGSSIWEAVSLQRVEDDPSQYKSMITAVQLARAELVIALCVVNIILAIILCKLSLEMRAHDKLQKSHAALQRQAAGVGKEYMRMTQKAEDAATDPVSAQKEQVQELETKCSDLQSKLSGERADKQTAQKELQDVKMQLKNLEKSFDELMRQNAKFEGKDTKNFFTGHNKDD